MPTTAELRLMDDRQHALLVVIDGIFYGFADHRDLTHMSPGGHSIRLGLTRKGLRHDRTVNLRTGQWNDDPWSFTVRDLEGDLARLFGAVDASERQLGDVPIGAGLPIAPPESLGGRSDLHSRNIGTERIGPNGERHLWPAPVGFTIGQQHAITTPGQRGAGAPVSENPIVWNGRRVVLYRCYRDHITYPDPAAGIDSWRPFSEAEVVAIGRMRDEVKQRGRNWTFNCDGTGSWTRNPLMTRMQREPVVVNATQSLSTVDGAREDGIGVQLRTQDAGDTIVQYGGRGFVAPLSGATDDDLRDDVIAEIAAAASAATDYLGAACTVWTSVAGHHVSMGVDGSITIEVPQVLGDPGGILHLCLHRKVWSLLGYHVEDQGALWPDPDDPKAVSFRPVDGGGTLFGGQVTGPDYWVGTFFTGIPEWVETGGRDNDGHARIYRPQYSGGTTVLLEQLNDGRGQVIRLGDAALGGGTSGTSVAHPGQRHRPVASDPTNPLAPISIPGIGECDRTGLWLFDGKRRIEGTDEVFDDWWIGEASWRNGGSQLDGLISGDTIIVTRWLNSGRYGFPGGHKHVGDWVARASVIDPDEGMIRAVPFAVLAHADGDNYDQAHVVMQRLMVTTGTSVGWSSFAGDPSATCDPGGNEPAGDHTVVRDAEVADLGLAIPIDFIEDTEAWRAVASRVEEWELLRCKYALQGGHSSADVFRSLMHPLGWCWRFTNNKLGIWCPSDPVTQADVVVALSPSSGTARQHSEGADLHEYDSEQRLFGPIDEFKLDYSWAPHLERTAEKLSFVSPDAGLRYRPGGVEENVLAWGMRNPAGFSERAAKIARFWDRRHFAVRGYPVHLINPGYLCKVGAVIRVTDPQLADPTGEYGIENRLAYVFGEHEDYEHGSKTIDMLVLADRSAFPRLHGPSARMVAHDSATSTVYVEGNWLGIEGDGWADVRQLEEPTYDGITPFGGAMLLEAYQWDGDTYAQTWSCEIVDVNFDTPGAHYFTYTGASGTLYRDMDTIFVPMLARSTPPEDWPQQIYGVVSDEAGEFYDGVVTQDGYPWEP